MNTRMILAVVVSMFVSQQVYAQDQLPELEGVWAVTELEGTWEEVSLGVMGNQILPGDENRDFYRFEGNIRFWQMARGATWNNHGAFTVDPSAMPPEIDFDNHGTLGIYKIEDDSLTICLGKPGESRPDRFESTRDSQTVLMVLRRVEDSDE